MERWCHRRSRPRMATPSIIPAMSLSSVKGKGEKSPFAPLNSAQRQNGRAKFPANMYPSITNRVLSRAACAIAGMALFFTGTLPLRAQVPLEMDVEEVGQSRALELATDEVEVARKGDQ